MKRIKKFYREHRVFTILMAIVLVCMVIIATVLIKCFYVGGDKGKYGDRLDGIEAVAFKKTALNDVESKIIAEKTVKSAKVKVTGRIVYIEINVEATTSLVEAQSVAQKSLDYFKKEEKEYYDFHYTLKQEKTEASEGYLISGAHNKNGSGLVWNNNNPVTASTEGTTEG